MYLKDVDVVPEVAKFQSALIVLCRFCPAASLAMRDGKPYIELFRNFLNTESCEKHINNMQSRLEKEGLKTNVFKGSLFPMPLNFITCFWTSGQREKLLKHAHKYEAIIVIGCEAAYESVCDILKSTDCQIFLGMESEGVFEAIPKFRLPFNISLELSNVKPVTFPDRQSEIDVRPLLETDNSHSDFHAAIQATR